ncbi:hypothetical protein ACVWU4_001039 [Campylobacter coli]
MYRYIRFCILLILVAFIISLLSACSTTTITKPVIKTETVEVKIPVKCKVPEITCDLKGNDFEVIGKMLECIVEQKRAIEVCSE